MAVGMIDPREAAARMFRAALQAADPAAGLDRHWDRAWSNRGIDPRDPGRPVMVISVGKSSIEMARACLEHLSRPVEPSVVAAVPERLAAWRASGTTWPGVEVMPADHPLPTDRSIAAASRIADRVARFASDHGERGIVIALISGGGSAQMCLPDEGLTLEDVRQVNRLLQGRGAGIHELNCVRKHTERLKGGRLGFLAGRATVQVFVASDVMGNDLGVVASGPFAPDSTTYAEALEVLDRYEVSGKCDRVAAFLSRALTDGRSETVKPGEPALGLVAHEIVSSNADARRGAVEEAGRLGIRVAGCTEMPLRASASGVGRLMVDRMESWLARHGGEGGGWAAMIEGGEPTVDTREAGASVGVGGPSQEVVLAGAVRAWTAFAAASMVVASFSTDGMDGPTDAAGAIADAGVIGAGGGLSEAIKALQKHDSHGFLGRAGGLVRTGPTGVNVNHVALVFGPSV